MSASKIETSRPETGIATKSSKNSTAHQTKISAAGDIGLISEGDLSTYGASIAANGNVVTDVNNINLGTQTTINTSSLDDQKKYWGGLFGGESQVQNNRTENLHGSSITANSNVVLGAKTASTFTAVPLKAKPVHSSAPKQAMLILKTPPAPTPLHKARVKVRFSISRPLKPAATAALKK